jgi:hypothetical protein
MPGPANASTATSPNLGAPGDAETVAQMRRALGQQLAAMRNRAFRRKPRECSGGARRPRTGALRAGLALRNYTRDTCVWTSVG